MAKRYYLGRVQDHFPMKSSNKGTPGIEITVDIHSQKRDGEFVPIAEITRRVWVWFPKGKSHELSLKKLRHAGWNGGGLSDLNLVGKDVELVGEMERYEGEEREKFELCLPPRGDGSGGFSSSERSEEAGLTIDAILGSAPVDLDAMNATSGESSGPSASEAPAFDDDDVPF